jgi:hypothetical protein
MARLGHASPRAALIYQHAIRERDHEIARLLSEAIEHALDTAASRASPRTSRVVS